MDSCGHLDCLLPFISFQWLDFLLSWDRFGLFGWLLLEHWCFFLRQSFWSYTFPCFVDLADDLRCCFFFLLGGGRIVGRSVLKVSFLVEVQVAKYRLHHLWKADATRRCTLNLSFLLYSEIRCFDRRHRGPRSINNQVLFTLNTVVPGVIESNLGSVRASFMVWQVLDGLFRIDDDCETSQVAIDSVVRFIARKL